MAKMYAFNEAERAAYLGVKKITHGKGKQIHPRKKWERKGSPGGGSASAGFGKVTQEITAADLTATPPYLGWGLINPASFLTPVSGVDTEPATEPDDLEIGFDGDTDMVIYSTAGEVIPVDTVIQWKTLEPDGKRFVDVVHCESARKLHRRPSNRRWSTANVRKLTARPKLTSHTRLS